MWLQIAGHDEVAEHFRRTLAAGRLANTYLFIGPEGVGKRTFALQLAQTLLCTVSDPAHLQPCGQCDSCRLFAAGNHPDLDVIGLPKGTRRLAIRQFVGEGDARNREGLCHNIALRPMLSRRRVAIIDDADWFTPESANCLLKTLEEPPPAAVIILIGTSRSRQLPTILSRAQVVRFKPLPSVALRDLLLSEGIASDPAAAAVLADRAGGSVSRSRELSDAALWETHDRVLGQWNAGAFDAPRLARDIEEFVNAAGKEADDRRQRFRQLLTLVGSTLAARMRSTDAPAIEVEATLAALDCTLQTEEQLDRNANQSTLLETWLDEIAKLLEASHAPTAR